MPRGGPSSPDVEGIGYLNGFQFTRETLGHIGAAVENRRGLYDDTLDAQPVRPARARGINRNGTVAALAWSTVPAISRRS